MGAPEVTFAVEPQHALSAVALPRDADARPVVRPRVGWHAAAPAVVLLQLRGRRQAQLIRHAAQRLHAHRRSLATRTVPVGRAATDGVASSPMNTRPGHAGRKHRGPAARLEEVEEEERRGALPLAQLVLDNHLRPRKDEARLGVADAVRAEQLARVQQRLPVLQRKVPRLLLRLENLQTPSSRVFGHH